MVGRVGRVVKGGRCHLISWFWSERCGVTSKLFGRVRAGSCAGACCDACHAESQCTDWFVSQGSCTLEQKTKEGSFWRYQICFLDQEVGNEIWWGTQGRNVHLSRCNEICSCEVQLPAAFAFCQTQRYMLLRKPKTRCQDELLSGFYVVHSNSSWMKHISLTDTFSGVLVQNATGGKPVGITVGSQFLEWLQLMLHEIPWVSLKKHAKCLQNGAVEAFFYCKILVWFLGSQSDLGWSPEIGAVAGRQGHWGFQLDGRNSKRARATCTKRFVL